MGDLLTVRQLQERLQISRKKAYDLCRLPDFPVCRLGGKILIVEDLLRDWIAAGGTANQAPPERRRA